MRARATDAPARDAGVGAAPVPVEEPDAGTVPAETPPTTAAVALVSVPLPDGGTMQGLTPSCTTRDGIEFDCAVEGYRDPGGFDDGGFDHTGEAQVVVSAAPIGYTYG